MRLSQKLIGLGLRLVAELRARGRGFEAAAVELERSGARLDDHLEGKPDTPGNREAIAHCVGIERWGQSRLRVGLGEPFTLDAHHGYRPDPALDIEALRVRMAATRADTVRLARALAAAGASPATTVRHNDPGRAIARRLAGVPAAARRPRAAAACARLST
jgi:hypothetical protein